jgi:thioredoxin:protein disulfide reductase
MFTVNGAQKLLLECRDSRSTGRRLTLQIMSLTLERTDITPMKRLLFGLVAALVATMGGWAQNTNPVVSAHAVMATDAAHASSPLKIAIVVQVAQGFHINDHKPTLDYLIPTQIKLDASGEFTVKDVAYPKGTLKKFPFSDVPLSVYEGNIVVGVVLQSGKGVPPGAYSLKGKFAYQACNDHACLAPTSVPLAISIRVVPPNVPLKAVQTHVFQRIKFE